VGLKSVTEKFAVYQHWDPLKTCVVGRSYPPEFYSFIKNSRVRTVFENLAIQTEEDLQALVRKLQEFDVEVWRPDIQPKYQLFDPVQHRYREPPMTPRDTMIMIGDRFYRQNAFPWHDFYQSIKANSWPKNPESIDDLPQDLQQECRDLHMWGKVIRSPIDPYRSIIERIGDQGNRVQVSPHDCINGSAVARLGKDLVVGTIHDLTQSSITLIQNEFADYRLHFARSDGHSDGNFCAVCPGLILSHSDCSMHEPFFPGWKVLQVKASIESDPILKQYQSVTRSSWWLPGFEKDHRIVEIVETYLKNFVGYMSETAFEVNILIVDPKNVIAFCYNPEVEKCLNDFGINLHVIPFRHRYFWDGGAHCVTLDLDRQGHMQQVL